MIFNFGRNKKNSGLHDLSDHELLQQYKQHNNPEIIAELFTRYTHLVYGICLKYLDDQEEAKDAVMEIFENLFRDLPEFEIRNFKNWLYSVARNHCLMELRKKKSIQLSDPSIIQKNDEIFMESNDQLHQELVMDDITMNDLTNAMGELKEQQRICLELVYLKEKSYLEVCEITGYSINEVKSHVQNGKRNLKIKLESRNAERD